MSDLLIQNGRVIDPANALDHRADVLIRGGRVAAVEADLTAPVGTPVLDATDLLVVPGLIDMHVHLREPGDEEEETIRSGATAALAGGFTSVVCMPNTDPTIDNEATVDFVYRQAAAAAQANVFPAGAITRERAGRELAEMGQMVRGGAVAFTDDGSGIQNPAVMLRAMKYAAMFDRAILQHCQDDILAGAGVMNAGYWATTLGLPGTNVLAEELMLYRDIQLARQAKIRYHAQHLSTRGSAEIVRSAKARGALITAEVTPHHLLLTEEHCRGYDSNFKVNPPLRSREDAAALLEAVADGTIDCLATDHAPHLLNEKELEFLYAPCGIASLECALGLFVKALVEPGVIGWPRLVEMLTVNPARVCRLEKGALSVGADADVTLIDPAATWTVDTATWKSKARNCPYNGWQLTARPVATIVAGEVRFSCY